jgi:hypothetical protein
MVAMASGQKRVWAGAWEDGLRPKTRVSVWSDVSRAKACGPYGCGRNKLAPLQRLTLCGCDVANAAIGAIGVIGAMYVHENFLRKLARVVAAYPTEPNVRLLARAHRHYGAI